MTIVLVMGYPASGKTTEVERFTKKGFKRLNRDVMGGGLDKIVKELEKLIEKGKEDFVLDNTYPTIKSRQPLIELAKSNDIPITCVHMKTSIEDAQVNAVTRMINKYGKLLMPDEIKKAKDPNTFPPAPLFIYRKQFEKPTKKEGFDNIEEIAFKRIIDPTYQNKAIILDYDGTLREVKGGGKYPTHPDQVEILPNRRKVLLEYQKKGYLLLGVSNQGDVGRNKVSEDAVIACFEKTNELLGIDIEYRFCPHNPMPIQCFCRKPMPGLGVEFIEKYKLSRDKTIYVGDRTTDKTFAKRSEIRFEMADDFFSD